MSGLEPLLPGSIKDQILAAIGRAKSLGERSDRVAISCCVECNASIFQVALEALERDDYVSCVDGNYVMRDSLLEIYSVRAKTKELVDRIVARSPAGDSKPNCVPLLVAEVTGLKQCQSKRAKACGKFKPPSEFYPKCAICKPCFLAHQSAKKADRKKKTAGTSAAARVAEAAAPVAQKRATPNVLQDVVIPNSGEIKLTYDPGADLTFITQGDDLVQVERSQLLPLSAFLSSVLERAQ